jgi:hypothetical protein
VRRAALLACTALLAAGWAGDRFLRSLGRSRSGAANRLTLRGAAVPAAPVAREQADVVALAEPSSEA